MAKQKIILFSGLFFLATAYLVWSCTNAKNNFSLANTAKLANSSDNLQNLPSIQERIKAINNAMQLSPSVLPLNVKDANEVNAQTFG
jgi:hypothetical protein